MQPFSNVAQDFLKISKSRMASSSISAKFNTDGQSSSSASHNPRPPELHNLRIHTKSIEKTLIPLVTQVFRQIFTYFSLVKIRYRKINPILKLGWLTNFRILITLNKSYAYLFDILRISFNKGRTHFPTTSYYMLQSNQCRDYVTTPGRQINMDVK